MKPRIFISTVTRELKGTRQRIANVPGRGFAPEWSVLSARGVSAPG